MSVSKEILLEVKDQIATITFNRPDTSNTYSLKMKDEIIEAVNQCSENDDVRVVILTGAGKHFCAGGNIRTMKEQVDAGGGFNYISVEKAGQVCEAVRKCNKPVIAQVNGAAVGSGAALAFASDYRVMTPKSKLTSGFIKVGASGDSGSFYYMTRLIGAARAIEFYMLGQTIGGEEALRLGLCNRLAEEDKLEIVTMKLASELVAMPTYAIGFQKQMFNRILYPDIDYVTELEKSYMLQCGRSADHKEAVYAFLEKRQPKFIGK